MKMLRVDMEGLPAHPEADKLQILMQILAQTQGRLNLCGDEGCNCFRVAAVEGAIRKPFRILVEGCKDSKWVEIPWARISEVVAYRGVDGQSYLWAGPPEDWSDHAKEYNVHEDDVTDHLTICGEVIETLDLEW